MNFTGVLLVSVLFIDFQRGLEVGHPLLKISDGDADAAKTQQNASPPRTVMVVGFGECQRGPKMRERIFVGEHHLSRIARQDRIVNGLSRDAALPEVMR